MKSIVLVTAVPALIVGAGVVSAAPALAPLPRDLPAQCAPLAVVPASARIPDPALAAHVSVASCLAEVAMDQVGGAPDLASIARLDAAVAPSLTILDDVIRVGRPYWRLIAQDAKRDLYQSMIVRERASATGSDIVARTAFEPELAPWHAGATQAMLAMTALGRDNPVLSARDAVSFGIVTRLIEPRPRTMARAAGH